MKNISLINKFIFILNSVFAVLLLVTYLAPFVNPVFFWPIAFLGLSYPFLLIINFIFGIYWLLKLKRQVLLPIIVIGCGWTQLISFFQLGGANFEVKKGTKVMSYNVRLFDLYNWSNNKQTRNKMFTLIDEQNVDILCLQEFFYSEDKKYFNTLDTLTQFLKAKNYHTVYTTTANINHNFGIATFSKYPIISRGQVKLLEAKNNVCIYTDVVINTDTIRVYNMHLASIHFKQNEYHFLENINDKETEEQINASKKIAGLLKRAFVRRSKQANTIAEHISKSPYKTIICGDFNDTPSSYAYKVLSHNLNDSFIESGAGIGATYNGAIPIFRIDYILHDKKLKATKFNTISQNLSDHFPISTIISFEEDN